MVKQQSLLCENAKGKMQQFRFAIKCSIRTANKEDGMRTSWDEYFMEIAEMVKTRSTCLRRQVGAVIVKDNHIITTGYNGAPSGLKHCTELGGCYRESMGVPSGERQELCRALHAEQNAMIQAANLGIATEQATLYVTLQPCVICAKMAINAGIIRIVYRGSYPDALSLAILSEAGIVLCNLDKGEENK